LHSMRSKRHQFLLTTQQRECYKRYCLLLQNLSYHSYKYCFTSTVRSQKTLEILLKIDLGFGKN
jgi:hypothetical protein